MTTEQQRSEALAKVLGIVASRTLYVGHNETAYQPELATLWLSKDYETLMKQAQKKLLSVEFWNGYVIVGNLHCRKKGEIPYGKTTFYADHSSEEAATCAALYDALMAVGRK
jgi:hypothetical protein